MTTRITTELVQGVIAGQALSQLLTGASIRFYSGPPPAAAALAPSGTLLATVEEADAQPIEFEVAGPLIVKKVDQTWNLTINAAGTLGYVRVQGAGLNSAIRVDSTDFSLADPNVTLTSSLELVDFSITLPLED